MKEKLKEIKQSFRLYMNGVTAQSLREKGLDYHLNWGASLQHLREMSDEIKAEGYDEGQLAELSKLLWRENVRECKILATLLMPPSQMPPDLAMLWVEQTITQEIAEIAAMNLYQHLHYAKDMAMQLIGQPYDMAQLQGYCIIARLFSKGMEFTESELDEIADQAQSAFQTENISLKHTIHNAMIKLERPSPLFPE